MNNDDDDDDVTAAAAAVMTMLKVVGDCYSLILCSRLLKASTKVR